MNDKGVPMPGPCCSVRCAACANDVHEACAGCHKCGCVRSAYAANVRHAHPSSASRA